MAATGQSRREMLEGFVASNPNDAFARYGLAMECVNQGDHEAAVQHFRQLLSAHPDYVAGYYHYGQLLAMLARVAEARDILTQGMAAAQKVGNTHAHDEMETALRELS